MNPTAAAPDRNPYAKSFLSGMKHHSLTTYRKLFSHILARSFFFHQEKKKVRRMATVQ